MRFRAKDVVFVMTIGLLAMGLAAPALGQDTAPTSKDGPKTDEVVKKSKPAAKDTANRIYEVDFQNGNFDHTRLAPLGHGSLYGLQLIRPEEKGLRITIPSHQGKDKPNVGIAPTFELHGDFEITASYEILAIEVPQPVVNAQGPFQGYGAGANLYILAQKTLNSATLRRCVMTTGAEVVQTLSMIRDDKGRRRWQGKLFATSSRGGSLRLVRHGDTLKYFLADEDGGEFVELHQAKKFGREPIGMVRVEAITDGSPTTVIVRWKSLKIEADKLVPVKIPVLTPSK